MDLNNILELLKNGIISSIENNNNFVHFEQIIINLLEGKMNQANNFKFKKEIIKYLRLAVVPERIIFAYKKCGYLITSENKYAFSPTDRKKWDKAIAKFNKLEGKINGKNK